MMKVLFRVDSSIQIGTGHLKRCLNLASLLRIQLKANVSFLTQNLPGEMSQLIKLEGFHYHVFSTEAERREIIQNITNDELFDLVIFDHYQIDKNKESQYTNYCKKIMVIDDLANRPHNCDLLLDQNLYHKKNRYDQLIPKNCRLLEGPDFCLLDPAYKDAREKLQPRRENIENVLVFFGGADEFNYTEKILESLKKFNEKIDINSQLKVSCILGQANPHKDKIMANFKEFKWIEFHVQLKNLVDEIINADLFIGAGGSTSWERCALGLPSIIWSIADNQIECSESLFKEGAIVYLGNIKDYNESHFFEFIEKLKNDKDKYKNMVQNCLNLVDCKGANRILKNIQEIVEDKHEPV